jgi:hypothetical protein
MIMRKRYFAVLEGIVFFVLLAAGGAVGLKSHKQKKELRQVSQLNEDQAKKIDGLVGELEKSNKVKDKITQDLLDTEKHLKEKAKTGFSILLEQAFDILRENKTPFTEKHVETAKGFVHKDVWGYDASAQLFKWNMETIKKQQAETKDLMAKNKELQEKYNDAQVKFAKDLGIAKNETIEHKLTASTLNEKVKNFTGENNILFWAAVGLGVYFFCSLGGFSVLGHFKRKAQAQLKETKTAIKTFTDVNPDGNETMKSILKATKIDIDND